MNGPEVCGSGLVRMCIDRAREFGYGKLTLSTNDVPASARKIYAAAGFTLQEEKVHHSSAMIWSVRPGFSTSKRS